jgi:hypothetical protein
MKYIIFGNGGSVDETMKLIKNPKETFNSINDIFDHLVDTRMGLNKRDLFLSHYCFDSRFQKEVYIITCAKQGNENYMRKYHWPQFLSYVVQV